MLTLIQLMQTVPMVTKATFVVLYLMATGGPGAVTLSGECPPEDKMMAVAQMVVGEIARRTHTTVEVYAGACVTDTFPMQPSA